jgi:hypothetical protein
MANINDIASYIYGRAPQFKVDPNLALGIARGEGLNPSTIGSPSFGNKDSRGYSFGPFQLFSGSPDPAKIAPGGMAYEFQQKFGSAPSRENWQQQVDFALERMGTSGTGAWHAVKNQGGPEAITRKGREYAQSVGLLGGPQSTPPEIAYAPPTPPVEQKPSAPVYSQDIGTSFQRMGNWAAPDWVSAPTPLTPDEATAQQASLKEGSEYNAQLGQAARSFQALQAMGSAGANRNQMLEEQLVRGQFRPIQKMRGLL